MRLSPRSAGVALFSRILNGGRSVTKLEPGVKCFATSRSFYFFHLTLNEDDCQRKMFLMIFATVHLFTQLHTCLHAPGLDSLLAGVPHKDKTLASPPIFIFIF